MAYANKFLKARGQNCIIERPTPFPTKVSMRRSTKASRDLGIREGYWEGLALQESDLQSGEVIAVGTSYFLVQTVNPDFASGELAFFAAKVNAILQQYRSIDNADSNNNIKKNWAPINSSVKAYGEIVTYNLRQEDPGLLDSTKYTFQLSKSLEIIELDRLLYDGKKLKVLSIDPMAMSGIVRCQAGFDERP